MENYKEARKKVKNPRAGDGTKNDGRYSIRDREEGRVGYGTDRGSRHNSPSKEEKMDMCWSRDEKVRQPMDSLSDEIKKFAGIKWNQLAQDRKGWRALGEAFVLQWT